MITPLALLHGFAMPAAFWDLIPSAAAATKLTLFGHEVREVEAIRSVDWHDEIARLAAALRARAPRWRIGGYSLGARVALGLLVHAPDLFERAILFSAQPGLADEVERRARAAQDAAWAECLVSEGMAAFVEKWERQPLFAAPANAAPPDAPPADANPSDATRERAARAQTLRTLRLHLDPRRVAASLGVLGLAAMPDYTPLLSHIICPVEFVAGGFDKKFCALAESMAAGVFRARVTCIARAGHNVVLDTPREAGRLLEEAS